MILIKKLKDFQDLKKFQKLLIEKYIIYLLIKLLDSFLLGFFVFFFFFY